MDQRVTMVSLMRANRATTRGAYFVFGAPVSALICSWDTLA